MTDKPHCGSPKNRRPSLPTPHEAAIDAALQKFACFRDRDLRRLAASVFATWFCGGPIVPLQPIRLQIVHHLGETHEVDRFDQVTVGVILVSLGNVPLRSEVVSTMTGMSRSWGDALICATLPGRRPWANGDPARSRAAAGLPGRRRTPLGGKDSSTPVGHREHGELRSAFATVESCAPPVQRGPDCPRPRGSRRASHVAYR